MPSSRWLVSLLIVYHLTALTVAAIPPPQRLESRARDARPQGAVARWLTPLLDQMAGAVARAEPTIHAALQPVGNVTAPYVRAGLTQRWNMFTSPSAGDRYVRLRYYVGSPPPVAGDVFQELILPVPRTEPRWYFKGKAIRNSLEAFQNDQARRAANLAERSERRGAALSHELSSVVRYYRNRFEQAHDLRVLRTELWYTKAPSPPRGDTRPSAVLRERLDALDRYRLGAVSIGPGSTYTRPGTVDREADLEWVLEYIEMTRDNR
jgi:hypothetical protein